MREAAAAPIAAALAAALALAALPSAAQPVPGTRFERFATRDSAGREIAFVLAPAAAPGAALALFVQGSGCAPLFRARQDGNFAGGYQATLAAVAAEIGRAHV